jgi:hypothetical protein
MGNALNLWNIFPKVTTSNIVSGFIVFTAVVAIVKKFKQTEPQKRKGIAFTYFWQLCLLIFVFFLTFLPNLAAKGNAAFYRCLIPLTSLIWLVLIWAIFQWKDIIPMILTRWSLIALLSTVVVYAGIKTYYNVLCYRVLPSSIEWTAYKFMAEEIRFNKVDAIYILLPYHHTFERNDEFGEICSHYLFDIYHLIYCAFTETGKLDQSSIPSLYFSLPDVDLLFELKEVYFKKMPSGKWVYKNINSESPFKEVIPGDTLDKIIHSGGTLDSGLTVIPYPQKMFSKRQNWYILNMNDIFSPSNYSTILNLEPKYY